MSIKKRSKQYKSNSLWIRSKDSTKTPIDEILVYILSGLDIGLIVAFCISIASIRDYPSIISLSIDKGVDIMIALLFTYYLSKRLDRNKNAVEKIIEVMMGVESAVADISIRALDLNTWGNKYAETQMSFETLMSDVSFAKSIAKRLKLRYAYAMLETLDQEISEFIKYLSDAENIIDAEFANNLLKRRSDITRLIRRIISRVI